MAAARNTILCLVYNFAPKYREGIFKLIDKEYTCHWYFGENKTDIKGLELSMLKKVQCLKTNTVIRQPLYWQKGVVGLLRKKEFETFFILGELHCLSTWMFLLWKKLFYREKRIYFWTHGWYGKETRIKAFLKKIFFKSVDGVFLYGNHARELMIKEGFDAEKLFVIHNSLAYDKQLEIRRRLSATSVYRAHFGNDNPNLIFIGRLTAVKRLDLLIEALAMLKEQGKMFNLTLIGDGTERQSLQQLAKVKEVESQVWFYGACYDERTNAELIYNADLCVSPGNVGLTAMHVMMFGTPVVTHNNFSHQMPEFESIHSGITGGFFVQNDVDSLVDCILKWFETHKGKRDEVRKACYKEIDTQWTPEFQMSVIRKNLKV